MAPTAVADKRKDRNVSETAAQKWRCSKWQKTTEKTNKTVELKAFDALFSKRDYKAVERCWPPELHSTQPGRPTTDGPTAKRESVPKEDEMTQTIEEKNRAFVLEAFETLFNKRDYAAAERFWSPSYIQHSKHIPAGRDGLFGLVKASPETMRYQNGAILAEENLLMLHGRFTGLGLPANWIVVDIVRLENGLLAEHWDVVEDEATRETSVSGLPMFGTTFPSE
jgi:predicted SnoaL-like aldol condensation-catalyzing enzyme